MPVEKTITVRINESIHSRATKEAGKYSRTVTGQLNWWINLGITLEKEYPEYFAEIIKHLHNEE